MKLEGKRLGERARVINGSPSLYGVIKTEMDEIELRKSQELDALQIMETKRSREVERGRSELMASPWEDRITPESTTLPVCTRTPRMIITGMLVARVFIIPIAKYQVSASTRTRDEIRLVLGKYLDRGFTLRELDYQPLD